MAQKNALLNDEPRIVEVKPQPDTVGVGVERRGAAGFDGLHVVVIEPVVLHPVFAIVGACDEELLHPLPLVEKVNRGATELVDLVAEIFLVELGLGPEVEGG